MKSIRQAAILNMIEKEPIETQEQLVVSLNDRGIKATQATVSRDIRELRLIKVLAGNGSYKYATPDRAETGHVDRFLRMLRESVLNIQSAGNLVVIKTLNGSANMAAEAIDSMHWFEVIGTLAGDNNILLVIRTENEVSTVVSRLQELIK